jgi:hypothetical protein
MSDLPLIDLQEVIEVTIFKTILAELVDKGYTPDITDISTYPDSVAGQAAYNASKASIISTKGFCVDLFNMSNPDYKGLKDLPRIVLIFDDPVPGDIGLDQKIDSAPSGLSFSVKRPPEIFDLPFSVYLISNNSKQRRVLIGILANSLPTKGYIPIYPRYSYRGFNIFIDQLNTSTIPSAIDGLMERAYAYIVKDLLLIEYEKAFDDFGILSQITVDMEIQQRLTSFQVRDA